ncbi:MAG: hypothetical protein ISN29_05140 [Gammaproteobacteria bacterium AqS3]|nr:hypothetical protein [Gammaproteobacteria bacterium AqS3]
MHTTSRSEIEWKEGRDFDPDIQMARTYYACVRGIPFGMISLFNERSPEPWIACMWDEKEKGFVQIGGLNTRCATRADAIEAVEREIYKLIVAG